VRVGGKARLFNGVSNLYAHHSSPYFYWGLVNRCNSQAPIYLSIANVTRALKSVIYDT